MITLTHRVWIAILAISHLIAAEAYRPGTPIQADYESFGKDFIEFYCFDCHGEGADKGDLSLDNLGPVDETNADLWKSIWAQVALQEMPPKKKDQPEELERIQFIDWVVGELQHVMKGKGGFHSDKDPKKGNFLAHHLLFGELPEGLEIVPPSSPKRIWRLTPSEHITRLNELINSEPIYDPKNPGLRTHGDAVSRNHGGELKLYFGVDRITSWQGGTVAYAGSVKAVPVVLASERDHGFENYAHFSSVNSAEVSQILNKAQDILRYMAYGPKSISKYESQITDDPAEYMLNIDGDQRGLPSALSYNTEMLRPETPLYLLLKEEKPDYSDENILEVISSLFYSLTYRPITEKEAYQYLQITRDTMANIGSEQGLIMGLSAIFLDRDALFHCELPKSTTIDEHGRTMLQDRELGLALNHALSYLKPDEILEQAILNGKMRSREDVRREVTRMLEDDSIRKPRVLQFFREYFDYDLASKICKDVDALREVGASLNANAYLLHMLMMTASTDRLVELILEEDQEVLKELLTTQKLVISSQGSAYFAKEVTEEQKAIYRKKLAEGKARAPLSDAERQEQAAINQLKKEQQAKAREIRASKLKLQDKDPTANPAKNAAPNIENSDKALSVNSTPENTTKQVTSNEEKAVSTEEKSAKEIAVDKTEQLKNTFQNKSLPFSERKEAYQKWLPRSKTEFVKKKKGVRVNRKNSPLTTLDAMKGEQISARVGYMSFGKGSLRPERLLTTARILTHPSWLISHSDAMDNHAIHRGIWVRNRLLGGGIPDVPITVDAQLPNEPGTTLRSRMRVTKEEYCWSCHEKMDPLGLTFEMYNHVGNFRTHEYGEPVNTSGEIVDSGVPELDGPVENAFEMITKLAESEHVEQVFVRHAFRYWMGRNETIHDRKTLQEAHKAYRENGGSMKALIISLVTSDSFLYRK